MDLAIVFNGCIECVLWTRVCSESFTPLLFQTADILKYRMRRERESGPKMTDRLRKIDRANDDTAN